MYNPSLYRKNEKIEPYGSIWSKYKGLKDLNNLKVESLVNPYGMNL